MKLVGSMTEQKIREELLASRRLFDEGRLPALRTCIQHHRPEVASAIILEWTPDPGEDLYLVLLEDQEMATVEIQKGGTEQSFTVEGVREYEAALKGRLNRLRLAVALDIARTVNGN